VKKEKKDIVFSLSTFYLHSGMSRAGPPAKGIARSNVKKIKSSVKGRRVIHQGDYRRYLYANEEGMACVYRTP